MCSHKDTDGKDPQGGEARNIPRAPLPHLLPGRGWEDGHRPCGPDDGAGRGRDEHGAGPGGAEGQGADPHEHGSGAVPQEVAGTGFTQASAGTVKLALAVQGVPQ